MGRQKINELDSIRAMAFLAVVMQHVLGAYLDREILGWEAIGISVLFLLSKFAVPAFVFVSGLVLFYNYYEKLKYGTFLIKRVTEILVPYLLWTVFYLFYNNPTGKVTIGGFIHAAFLGKGAYHLWYVIMIFQFYVLLPVYIAIFKGIKKLVPKISGRCIVFAVFTLMYMLYILVPSYLTPRGLFKPQNPVVRFLFVDFVTRNSVSYIFYFIMGAVVGLNIDKFKDFIKRYTALITGAFLLGFCLLEGMYLRYGFAYGKPSVNYPSFFKPHYFFFTVIMIVFLYRLSLGKWLISGWVSKVFAFMGSYSYTAYLAHAYTLKAIALRLYKTSITFRPLIYGLVFVGCIVFAFCIAFLLRFLWTTAKSMASRLKPRLCGKMK